MSEENLGISYAREKGVDIKELHKKITDGIDARTGEPRATFSDAELQVLRACVEVACEW